MKVILVGYPKTGTKTMATAMSMLGYKVYDFMEHFWYHEKEWKKILTSGGCVEDFRKMYADVDVIVDTPTYFFWEQILEAFPRAKVILTLRDEDAWAKSWCNQMSQLNRGIHHRLIWCLSPLGVRYYGHFARGATACFGFTLNYPWTMVPQNEMMMRVRYRQHNLHVLKNAPPDQLLVYQVQDGWNTLCKFLDRKVPNEPFPYKNAKGSSSFSSSRNNSLFGLRPMALSNFNFGMKTFNIPRITITGPNDFIPKKDVACPMIVEVQTDYLEVLNLYLGSKCGDPIYEELVDCVTAPSGGCDMTNKYKDTGPSAIYSHIKRENAKYAVIKKGPRLQEATLIDAVVCEPVYGTLRINHEEIKPAGHTYDADGTSDTIHNECVDEIIPHFADTLPKAKHVVVERSSKNYVVVAPKLFCKRVAACAQGFSHVTSSLADVSPSKTRNVSSDCIQIHEDSASFSVFMEMNV